jgi:hypothetical protein
MKFLDAGFWTGMIELSEKLRMMDWWSRELIEAVKIDRYHEIQDLMFKEYRQMGWITILEEAT